MSYTTEQLTDHQIFLKRSKVIKFLSSSNDFDKYLEGSSSFVNPLQDPYWDPLAGKASQENDLSIAPNSSELFDDLKNSINLGPAKFNCKMMLRLTKRIKSHFKLKLACVSTHFIWTRNQP